MNAARGRFSCIVSPNNKLYAIAGYNYQITGCRQLIITTNMNK